MGRVFGNRRGRDFAGKIKVSAFLLVSRRLAVVNAKRCWINPVVQFCDELDLFVSHDSEYFLQK